jgi:hypothetical protein
MKERVDLILEKIKRVAELILEHQAARGFKDNLITVGAENIISMAKEAVEELEKQKKEV